MLRCRVAGGGPRRKSWCLVALATDAAAMVEEER